MWDVERKRGVRDDSRILGAWATRRMKSPLTEMEKFGRSREWGCRLILFWAC